MKRTTEIPLKPVTQQLLNDAVIGAVSLGNRTVTASQTRANLANLENRIINIQTPS